MVKNTLSEASISVDVLEKRETVMPYRSHLFGPQHLGDDRAGGTTAFRRRTQILPSMNRRHEVASQTNSFTQPS